MRQKKKIANLFTLFCLCFSILTLCGCGNGAKQDGNTNVPAGMVAADLSAQGLNILVNVPDSTVAPLMVTANPQGGADIKVGSNFQMTIIEGPGNMELKKNDITNDAIRKLVKYIVQKPDTLVWEWQIEGMAPDFHFYTIIKVGQQSYEVHEMDGGAFSEKAIMQMLNAAKSIRAKAPSEKKNA